MIELLITASIAVLISMAVFAVFSAGVNVYERVSGYSDIRRDVLLSLEKIEKDLRNACNVSSLEFRGEASKMTFPALVSAGLAEDKKEFSPGSVSYYVDDDHSLVSEARDYPGSTAKEPREGVVTQLVRATSVGFSYYYYDPKLEAYAWGDTWVKEADEDKKGTDAAKLGTAAGELTKKKKIKVNTPLGVKIKIEYEDRGRPFVLTRTVFFPLAVSLRIAETVNNKEEKARGGKDQKA